MNKVTMLLLSVTVFGLLNVASIVAQDVTMVYNDTTASGIWFQGSDGGQVANPVKDDVNGSDSVAVSATDGNWQQIQFFPLFTPKEDEKLYFYVYNPNGAGPGQVQFSYSGSDDWQWGDNITYDTGSEAGWVQYYVDLAPHLGNEIDQIIIMPAGDNSVATYIDDIFVSTSADPAPPPAMREGPVFVYNDTTASGIWFQGTDGGQMANPVKDDVNGSDSVAVSATDGNWQQIQLFPLFTAMKGEKLYFSVYNPNGAGPGQVQFSYTGSTDWQWGDNVTYEVGSETGWVEYTVDLVSHLGNEIDQIIIMPAGDNSAATYIDNVYISEASELTVSIESEGDPAGSFELLQNYPNPFNPSTNISFSMPNAANVTLTVYNVLGQEVASLIDNRAFNAGAHVVSFDASSLSSGMYIYRIEAGNFISTKRMVLIK